MIFCKIFVVLCLACAVFGSDESTEASTEIDDTTEHQPSSVGSSENDDAVMLTSTEEPVTTSTTEHQEEIIPETPVVHPSSAQLQLNETDAPYKVGIAPCVEDTTCADLENTFCKEGLCHCQQSFLPHPTNWTSCIKSAEKIGDKCEFTKQCENINGICSNSVCKLERIESAKIPLSAGINAATSVLSGSFFILSIITLFLVY